MTLHLGLIDMRIILNIGRQFEFMEDKEDLNDPINIAEQAPYWKC